MWSHAIGHVATSLIMEVRVEPQQCSTRTTVTKWVHTWTSYASYLTRLHLHFATHPYKLQSTNYIDGMFAIFIEWVLSYVIDFSKMNPTAGAASQTTRPLKRFALHSTKTCATQATKYGKCVVASYTDVSKGMCKQEFSEFRQCLRQAVRLSYDLRFRR